ncbi:FAD-dependent oxidoreductase [Tianweitania populi]|uniref:Glutamate synthase n=1 Tax=Tianweitania populi TaxID=1607949 RepID=A0A8J3DVS6_9HYPH|nr:NAD(P)/FAD-dependent oxidoreductase [Tianweitania populi]GHD10713.1 glutamate synthase [Tianweitania populi]
MKQSLSIAIVGAGPGGLATALLLKRRGHDVRVFERFEQAAPVGSGLILQPTGLSVLAYLGLLPAMLARGARIDRLTGADARSGRTVLDVRYDALAGGRFGLGTHRAALFDVLHDAVVAARIPIMTGTDAQSLHAMGDGIGFDASGLRHGPFDLIVDASGARSTLRRHAVRPVEPRPLTYGAIWATLDWVGEGFDPNALQQRYERAHTMVGVLPVGRVDPAGGEKAAFFWSLKPAEIDAVKAGGLDVWKSRVFAVWPACAPYLDQITDFDSLTLARYGHHTLLPQRGERIVFLGDAAHATSPQLGQGANMALLDAAALDEALRRSDHLDQALDVYGALRRNHIKLFQALSLMLTPFYQSDGRVLPWMRDTLVAVAARVPPVPQILGAMVAGTLLDPLGRIGLAEPDWTAAAGTMGSAEAPTQEKA